VRRKKRKKRRKAAGELDGPDALHLAHDPKRHRAFGREACTSARGAARPAQVPARHEYIPAAIPRGLSGCDAGAGALASGSIAARAGEADAHPEGRECLTLKLPLVAMQYSTCGIDMYNGTVARSGALSVRSERAARLAELSYRGPKPGRNREFFLASFSQASWALI
jgi:hypothetical protein